MTNIIMSDESHHSFIYFFLLIVSG
jgi:hypothetical protein